MESQTASAVAEAVALEKSGWRDSNSRPPDPQSGALTKLRYSPFWFLDHVNDLDHSDRLDHGQGPAGEPAESGQGGIRTRGTDEPYTAFPMPLLKPLGHLSRKEGGVYRTDDPAYNGTGA